MLMAVISHSVATTDLKTVLNHSTRHDMEWWLHLKPGEQSLAFDPVLSSLD